MEVARQNAMTNCLGVHPTSWNDVSAYAVALRDSDTGAERLMLSAYQLCQMSVPFIR